MTTEDPSGRRTGSAIIFQSSRKSGPGLYRKNSNGAGEEQLILAFKEDIIPYQWPSAGEFIYFVNQIFRLSLTDLKSSALALPPSTSVGDPGVSPDGRRLAYTANEAGRWNIHVTTFPPSNLNVRTGAEGVDTMWSRTGKELFYVNFFTGALMTIDVLGGNPPQFGTPHRVYAGPLSAGTVHSFSLDKDDQRILVHTTNGEANDITILLNWQSLLKK